MKLHRLLIFVLSAILGWSVSGCNKDAAETDKPKKAADTIEVSSGNYEVYPNNIQIIMSSPIPNQMVSGDSVLVELRTENFGIGEPSQGEQSRGIAYSTEGQHVYLTIDDTMQIIMTSGQKTLEHLAPGKHSIKAIVRYSWSECIKRPITYLAFDFYVAKPGEKVDKAPKKTEGKDTTKATDSIVNKDIPQRAEPTLVYSAPSGELSGDDEKILLDFFVAYAELGKDKFCVVSTIDGTKIDTLREWLPYYINGLKPGTHSVKLELLGPDKQSHGAYQRSFTITPPSPKPKDAE